ncbi:unnamed protein product [Pieris macdunnoughi]|uniref:Uncharacterized protein n=1 Tax=Pieris macdunnoughi TaxID=345717 RepID=A0A821W942_9NEOP|nr:unnamed protein product [Pieris macdunnoughi]
MSTFALLVVCVQACLFQNVFCWIAEPALAAGPLGCASGLAGIPAPFGRAPFAPALAPAALAPAVLAPAAFAPAPFAPAPFAPALSPAVYEAGIGAYGGEGIGDVAVAGEMPVAGTTMVAGQVPILGAVRFAGDLPAGGVVTIVGNSGAGRYAC